ncbi:pyridoxal phosphate-dependent aminotransferase [Kitasatospora sp. NBC_00374]|uniref:pyridoxal phosphate-dependent aminotransferase n=1 Tax=Kitasatospora sp. NBC_00374 TaxID=2975964 RepID=UPI0030E3D00C
MKNRTAARFSGIEKSATFAVVDTVRALRAQGVHVLDLGSGEPSFDTSAHITAEASKALLGGFTHYTPSRGLPELLEAIAGKLARDNAVVVDPATDIIVTPSAKHALYISMMSVLDPGDEVIIPTPSWVSYQSMARLAGARPVAARLSAQDGFRLSRALLERYVTERTKALLINTPNNPTGRALTRQEAFEVAEFAAEHDLLVITDEIYEKVLYGAEHLSLASLPAAAGRTLVVNGFSKGYAMTGWRLGYVAGPGDVIGEMVKVQEHSVGCAGSFVQRGGLAALTGAQDFIREMVDEYAVRREVIVAGLNALPGVSCELPEGALYAFPDISATGLGTSAQFAAWLLEEAGVAVTPGSAFGPGGEGHVRLSFATSRDVIEAALERMATALAGRRGAAVRG